MHIHTHYDNLQVPYTATDAEIRQAYRRLSRKYHPDLNPDPDAHRIMQLINRAYDVLSDPRKRAEHDFWIEAQRRRRMQEELGIPTTLPHAQRRHHASTQYRGDNRGDNSASSSQKLVLVGLIIISLIVLGLVAWQGTNWFTKSKEPQLVSSTEVIIKQNEQTVDVNAMNAETPTAAAQPQVYIRPTHAPNGSPLPSESGYVNHYPQITGKDGSSINVENIRNSSDVFAQLHDKRNDQPVRTFFIEERSEFLLEDLDAGEYYVRYHQLDTGEYFDSESVGVLSKDSATIYLQRSGAPQ